MAAGQPPTEAPTSAGMEQHTGRAQPSATSATAQPPRKWARVLRAFADGKTLNRFDAYRELRDSCLNTTVSQIERRDVRISRREETVPGAFGPVHCCRYWLASESLQHARELLGLPTDTSAPALRGNALEAAA